MSPNPSELLIQDNFPGMMKKLREQYDYVFIQKQAEDSDFNGDK